MTIPSNNREWALSLGVWSEKRKGTAPAHVAALDIAKRRHRLESREMARSSVAWLVLAISCVVKGPAWLDLTLSALFVGAVVYSWIRDTKESKAFRAERDAILDAYDKAAAA